MVIPLSVLKSLAFCKSTNVVPNFLISNPLTYATPSPRPIARSSSLASTPFTDCVPAAYIPRFVPDNSASRISISKGSM